MCQAGNGSASFSILAFELEHATPVCRRLSWYLGIRMNDDDTRETDFVLKYVCLWVRVRVCARVEIVSCQIVRGTTMTICCTCPILNKHLHSMAAAFAWHHDTNTHTNSHTHLASSSGTSIILCVCITFDAKCACAVVYATLHRHQSHSPRRLTALPFRWV